MNIGKDIFMDKRKMSKQIIDFLGSEKKLVDLTRLELVELASDSTCPQFLMEAIATQLKGRF